MINKMTRQVDLRPLKKRIKEILRENGFKDYDFIDYEPMNPTDGQVGFRILINTFFGCDHFKAYCDPHTSNALEFICDNLESAINPLVIKVHEHNKTRSEEKLKTKNKFIDDCAFEAMSKLTIVNDSYTPDDIATKAYDIGIAMEKERNLRN